jgi:hypothetical protein
MAVSVSQHRNRLARTHDRPRPNTQHTRPEDKKVYHDQSECGYGKEIKSWHRVNGTDNRRLCDRCSDLAS